MHGLPRRDGYRERSVVVNGRFSIERVGEFLDAAAARLIRHRKGDEHLAVVRSLVVLVTAQIDGHLRFESAAVDRNDVQVDNFGIPHSGGSHVVQGKFAVTHANGIQADGELGIRRRDKILNHDIAFRPHRMEAVEGNGITGCQFYAIESVRNLNLPIVGIILPQHIEVVERPKQFIRVSTQIGQATFVAPRSADVT